MNNALRNTISRPSLRAAVSSIDPIIDSGAATSLRPIQPGHCLDMVSASSQYIDTGAGITGATAVDISFTINPDSLTNSLIGCGATVTADKGFYLRLDAGVPKIEYSDGTTAGSRLFALTLSTGTWYECQFTWTGGTAPAHLIINGVDYSTVLSIAGWAGASADNLTFGAHDGGVTGFFDGKLGFCKYDGVLQYNNDFSTGTAAINSLSAAAADGTLVNTPTWTTDNTLPYSWLNQVGYTDVSGLLTPRDESAPTLDTDGNALEWSGSAFPRRPVYRDSYAGVCNGSTTYLTKSIANFRSADASGKITGDFKTSLGTGGALLSSSDTAGVSNFLFAQLESTGSVSIRLRQGATDDRVDTVATFDDGFLHSFEIRSSGSAWSIYVDGTLQSLTVTSGSNSGGWFSGVTGRDNISLGMLVRTSPVAAFNGTISNIKVYAPSDVLVNSWGITEGVGDTAHDTVGTCDLTWQSASTATEGAGAWAGRIDGETNAHNINNGFSLYESGANDLRVPYVSGAAHPSPTIPGGYTLTSQNPAVANSHNDAETTWDCENIGVGDTIAPETDHLSSFDAITFADTNYSLGITAPIDTVFWYDFSTTEKKRLIAFDATQTGSDLVWANNYTYGERWNDLAPWDDDTFWND